MQGNHKAIFVDTFRCVGCHACETACKVENGVPPGPKWIQVIEVESRVGDTWRVNWKPMACMHCGVPACQKVCPTRAISKRIEDGIVLVDRDICIGCMECFRACPFGAPQLGEDRRMQKCTLCVHRTANGDIPACVESCPSEAMYYGDLQELSRLIRGKYSARSIGRIASVVNPSLKSNPFLP